MLFRSSSKVINPLVFGVGVIIERYLSGLPDILQNVLTVHSAIDIQFVMPSLLILAIFTISVIFIFFMKVNMIVCLYVILMFCIELPSLF